MMHILALLLATLLLTGSAQAQQVPNPMSKDAANALPQARDNLELGTVKSEGGTPPDAITSFYTWDKTRPQFQVLNNPNLASEWVSVQAGVTGGGATHLCTGYNPNVQCNYVGLGTGGHLFGNGYGNLLNLQRQGTGSIKSYLTLWGSGDDTARLDAAASYYTNVKLQVKAKGTGEVILRNDVSKLAQFDSTGGTVPDTYLLFQGGNDGTTRVIGSSDAHPVVHLEASSKGAGEVRLKSGAGNLAVFADSGGAPDAFVFTAGNGLTFTSGRLTAGFGGIQLNGQRIPVTLKATSYLVTSPEAGTHFTNRGATASVTFTLPEAVPGNNYCFSVDAAFQVIVKANAADKIALAAANSVAGGQVAASAPFASVCLVATQAGQWIARSTPDKTQWTVT